MLLNGEKFDESDDDRDNNNSTMHCIPALQMCCQLSLRVYVIITVAEIHWNL